MTRQVTLTIPMIYEGGLLSKNRLFRNGDRRAGMTSIAKAWKQRLADSIQPALWEQGLRDCRLVPPVSVTIYGEFTNKRSAPNMHNLAELAVDAVQEGTGIDDKHYSVATFAPIYGVKVPGITVKVTMGVEEGDANRGL